MYDDFLLQARKPARYIGEEWNISKKDFAKSQIRFALCFPDLYEIGMSNLGLRIIYDILNNVPEISCERFFSPAPDFEKILRDNKIEFVSLESKKPLKDFDLVGFSLGYELCFTNVLNLLELGGIPLSASERDGDFPLVIGGGPCTLNPEPMHKFFDLFVIGEAEEVILEITGLYAKLKDEFKTGRLGKQELLTLFSRIEGVYVPSLYDVEYESDGKIKKFIPKSEGIPLKIKKRFVKDLSVSGFPLKWLVPYIEIVHDRITLELMRGCPNACRFCQARHFYFPVRQRSPEDVLHQACTIHKNTGYEEISLTGLSVSDYPKMGALLEKLVGLFKDKAVGISLPSIKPKMLVGNFASLIATIKKTGLTFAPEAATERLRKVLNKDFDLKSLYLALKEAYAAGYRRVKLYFMIGLPSETQEDLDGIVDFSREVSDLKKEADGRSAEVNISINTLIPKPHTPMQWLAMANMAEVEHKINYLRKKLNTRKIQLKFHNPEMSFLEGVFARGDRRLSNVVESAFYKGARFDAWDEHFILARWLTAFSENNIEADAYLKARSINEFLPWDFLDIGSARDGLLKEYQKLIDIT